MSEYQYYEFQAVEQPLTKSQQERLRRLSTRARITSTSFTNHYDWGDFRGDPRRLMEECFDLHLCFAHWGTRRLMMRLPKGLIDRRELGAFLDELDWVKVWDNGENSIIDVCWQEEEPDEDPWDEGNGWLAALAPLRAAILAGDLRLFYILWLRAVAEGLLEDDVLEPLPGIGPLTRSLEAAAAFFKIDGELVEVAGLSGEDEPDRAALRAGVAALADEEKTDLLIRLIAGDAGLGPELRRRLRTQDPTSDRARRTVGELREKAGKIRELRAQAEAERLRAEERRRKAEAEKVRRARLDVLRRQGKAVYPEIEKEIERRNAPGYNRATRLLADLKELAAEEGFTSEFDRRLADIRRRHARKGKFIARLKEL